MSGPRAPRTLGLGSAAALVVASMIGAGIFSTTGTLAAQIGSPAALLGVWLVGGALALAAALSFGELGAMMPEAGAEVHYLRRVFGPWVGFQAGFVTFLAGFAVPIAAVGSVLGQHLEALAGVDARLGAVAAIALATAIHAYGVSFGARVNDVTCVVKLLIVAAFVVAGLLAEPAASALPTAPVDGAAVVPAGGAAAFAHGLVLVAFAYTGWNAAAYVGGEIREPGRQLPRALLLGTGLVTALYLLCNVVFLRAAAPAEMAGVEAVGQLAADRLFSPRVATAFSGLISLLLLSTISSFAMAGPRVAVSMAEDGELPALLARRNRRGAPTAAAILLGGCSLAFLATATFHQLLEYVGILLTLSAGLAVLGLLVLRRRAPDAPRPFRVPLYPWLPLAFLALSTWMLFEAVRGGSAVIGAVSTLALGTAVRWGMGRWRRAPG